MSGSIAAGPRPSTSLLMVGGVNKRFGGVRALRDVNLEVRPGEVHALLGENGAGKSTLIKILSGVHAADSGSIEIAGRPVAFDSPARSRGSALSGSANWSPRPKRSWASSVFPSIRVRRSVRCPSPTAR